MTFSIPHALEDQLKEHSDRLLSARVKVEEQLDAYNTHVTKLAKAIASATKEYNRELGRARKLVEAIGATGQNAFEEQAAAWQESDEGVAAQNWISAYVTTAEQMIDADVEFEAQALTIDDVIEADHVTMLDKLPFTAE